MLKIAIISGPENGSPKVLAETLHPLLKEIGHVSEIFYQAKAFKRLLPANKVKNNNFLWYLYKAKKFFKDRELLKKLKEVDAVIICDWTPHGFYTDTYNIEKLREIIKKPILYYAVQYMGNSPSIIDRLKKGNHALQERYDWHLAVSAVTELRGKPSAPWSQIGMNLKSTGLKPIPRQEFYAIVDFLRPGYEKYRDIQIRVLEDLKIPYISLEREYTLTEIRELYKKASIIFLQFPEAYGLPIAECLATGSYIGTPDSSWAMSWRLDEVLEQHGTGTLPECFVVYDGAVGLKNKLKKIREEYDLVETPNKVFNVFLENYRDFYEGNKNSLIDVMQRIEENNFS